MAGSLSSTWSSPGPLLAGRAAAAEVSGEEGRGAADREEGCSAVGGECENPSLVVLFLLGLLGLFSCRSKKRRNLSAQKKGAKIVRELVLKPYVFLSELVAGGGQGDWLHDHVALEMVHFEIAGAEPSTLSSPSSRQNFTLSRGTQEAPPPLLSPECYLSGGSFLILPQMCVGWWFPQHSSFPHHQDVEQRPRSSLQLSGAANACQKKKIPSSSDEAGAAGAKRADEAPRPNLHRFASGRFVVLAVYGYILLHPYHLPV